MDLLEQCRHWHEQDEYQKIIETLEAVPSEERTPEMDSELARAYNNLADPYVPEGVTMLKRAIDLLRRHEEYFQGDHFWNFRMGYACYYLDQEGPALRYFEKALEASPGDEDTQEFISNCQKQLTFPHFGENFRERTAAAWEAFEGAEAELRRVMDEDKTHEHGAELAAKCNEILHLAFENVAFEMGFSGEKHELILSPEGNKVRLFELVYFKRQAPASVLTHWNILVGRQPSQGTGLRAGDWEISGDDVQIWVERSDDNRIGLTLYSEKLLPLSQEDEDRAWWMLSILTDQALGEIPVMRYIDKFNMVQEPVDEPSILLSQLWKALEDMGLDLSTDPEAYLENSYTGYRMKPVEDPDADWRLDIISGSTSCPVLLNEYMNNESGYLDDLHADGVAAGFLCYPLDSFNDFEGEERTRRIFDFRDRLEAALMEGGGADSITLTGGATGLYYGYVDFIAWDLITALNHAKAFFEESGLPWASFHVFRRDMGTVLLKNQTRGNRGDAGNSENLEYIPYIPENAEAFCRQLEWRKIRAMTQWSLRWMK